MIAYLCARCGEPLAAPDSRAGRADNCPKCGNANRVPPATSPAAGPVRIVAREGLFMRTLNVGCAVVLAIIIIVLSFISITSASTCVSG